MDQYQDLYYVNKVTNGETNAFSVLVDRYKIMVFTISFRILKNREEAEEVAHDTFLNAYNSLHSFKGESKFTTWIYKIAYHRSLDYLKKRKTTIVMDSLHDFSDRTMPLTESVLDRIEEEDRKIILKKAMDLLPSEYSVVVTLYYLEELSLREISKITGTSSDTVKVKLFRARKKLAEILKWGMEPEIVRTYGNK